MPRSASVRIAIRLKPDGRGVTLQGWRGRVWQSAAVEPKPLSGLAAGRTLKDTTLDCERRRRLDANVQQAHLRATRQTLHNCPRHPIAEGAHGDQKCA